MVEPLSKPDMDSLRVHVHQLIQTNEDPSCNFQLELIEMAASDITTA